MDAVIDTFGRHRLLSFDRDPDTREPTVEIAHEALLREWTRFRAWIDEARDVLRQRTRISSGAIEWTDEDRSPEYLMSGVRLAQAEEVTRGDSIRLTDTERDYLDASLAHRDAEVAAEQTRHERELTLERRARTRLRGLVAVLAASTVLAATLTVVAVDRSRQAERSRDESTVTALTSGAVSNLTADPDLSVLLALHAIDTSASIGQAVPSETVNALHLAMQEANIEYPVATGDTAVVSGPLGVRGIYDLPLTEIADTARADVQRSLTPSECERYLATTECPPLPQTFPAGLASEPLEPVLTPAGSPPLSGTEVTLFGGADTDRMAIFEEEFEAFSAETGIDVRLVGNPLVHDYVAESAAEGDPPDIAVAPQPGTIMDLGREGHLIDLASFLDLEALRNDQSPYLVSLGTMAEDGSWPAQDGTMYGAFSSLNLKSMVWYPLPELREAGYPTPTTWDELIALSDGLVGERHTPWCMGWESGPGASGWPGTDWIENLLLKDAGPIVYDQWTTHEIPFDSPPVRDAFVRLGQILFTDGYLAEGAVEGPFDQAQLPMVEQSPPGCWLHQFPSFGANFIPPGSVGSTTDFIPFPSVGAPSSAVMGAGDMIGVFSDRPEVREVVRYMLGPEYGARLTETLQFLSPNRRFDVSNYDPFEQAQAELIDAALEADAFRFDASDLMPPPIGGPDEETEVGLFWNAMMRYAREGPSSLDAILAELDAAWPDG
jgi:alpha-glucoside transport system substrate-binding protein